MSGFWGLPVPSFFMASGTRHVLDGYEPPRARALDRGEVYAQLLRSTPGGVCGPRLLCSVSPGGLPGLIGDLPGLSCACCGLPGLRPPGLPASWACLACPSAGLPRRVLHALGDLPYLSVTPPSGPALLLAAGEPTDRVLHALDGLAGLVGCLAGGVLGLLGRASCGVLGLPLPAGLLGGLPCYLLGLPGSLSSRLLRSLRGLASGPILAGLRLPSPRPPLPRR